MKNSAKGSFLLLLALLATSALARSSDKVLLKDVQALTLRKDRQTTHRRVAPVPQLKCVGGAGCRHHKVELMRCENAGADYDAGSVQWTCRADVPTHFKLGATDVRCEGYSGPADPYVLKGSCGVEYRLLLTDKGEEKYGRAGPPPLHVDFSAFGLFVLKLWRFAERAFYVVFFALAGWLALLIVRSIVYGSRARGRPATTQPPRRPPFDGWGGGGGGGWFDGWGGGGGGGGGYPPRGPPPPYTQFPPRKAPAAAGQAWRPGFWSGLFGGGAAGYYAGRQARDDRRRGHGADHRDRGGMFGEGPSRPPPRSEGFGRRFSTDSSSSAGEMHTTTGFGGTNNR